MDVKVDTPAIHKPCAFNPAGLSEGACSSLSRIPIKNQVGCTKSACLSPWRICAACIRYGGQPSVVSAPGERLCAFHKEHGEATEKPRQRPEMPPPELPPRPKLERKVAAKPAPQPDPKPDPEPDPEPIPPPEPQRPRARHPQVPWADLLERYAVLNKLVPEVQTLLDPNLPVGERLTVYVAAKVSRYPADEQLALAMKIVVGKKDPRKI